MALIKEGPFYKLYGTDGVMYIPKDEVDRGARRLFDVLSELYLGLEMRRFKIAYGYGTRIDGMWQLHSDHENAVRDAHLGEAENMDTYELMPSNVEVYEGDEANEHGALDNRTGFSNV